MRNGFDKQKLRESSDGLPLSNPAQKVWDQFWELSPQDKDLLMAKMLAQIPLTIVVGGQGQAGELTVYPRCDVNGILGDLVHRQTRKTGS